ncbi:hypothetical protein GLAREA_00296 [Glarea lozoyensis ATCC 20868]|uniref:Uncharacterized protein n=1 Tax=Glarea lozoyensis (strain ATCC 20868 / MF5171) TaxID=1116229 RepID=S3DRQ3_GLAL2|nr:uncharacterized protein GLAREA_00296 [Glarea lozoyensis ATCC 20868]EPE29138.1 hypothetical protein GLAREA_00296 [Glarea lozoyensis ATCC 20868]
MSDNYAATGVAEINYALGHPERMDGVLTLSLSAFGEDRGTWHVEVEEMVANSIDNAPGIDKDYGTCWR